MRCSLFAAFTFVVVFSVASSAWAQPDCTSPEAARDYAGDDVFLLDDACWTGTHENIGTLTIGPTFTLQSAPGAFLRIEADRVDVAGRLSADEAGNTGGAGGGRGEAGSPGVGSGAGGAGTPSENCAANPSLTRRNAGGGGGGAGGYGGAGSAGGHGADAADNGCQGGAGGAGGGTFGTTAVDALSFGSGGGGGGGAGGANFESGEPGSRGGGVVILEARELEITGVISANGGLGGRGGTSPDLFHGGGGGGGAAGGGVHVRTTYLIGDGVIEARGGSGGAGGLGDIRDGEHFSGAGGGGGGGGRVLIERSSEAEWTGSCSAAGGPSGSGSNTNSGPSPAGSAGECQINTVNGAPEANAGGPYAGAEGAAITFDGSDSTDPDDDDLTYSWDLGCDDSAEGTGVSPAITIADNRVEPYVICLTVSDGELESTAQGFVTVFDLPPVGVITLPEETPLEGDSFTVSAGDSFADGADSGSRGTISDSIVRVEWDWEYDVALGFVASGDEGTDRTRSFVDNGRFFIAARVWDEDGGSAVTVAAVDVANVAPVITSLDWPTEVFEGQVWRYEMEVLDPGILDTFEFEVLSGPIGMGVDVSGEFSWTPLYSHAVEGSVTARLSVTDKDFGRAVQTINVNVLPADIDEDGMPDGWEAEQVPPLNIGVDDSEEDPDGDGVGNRDEFLRGSDPRTFDGPGAPRLAFPPRGYETLHPADLNLSVFTALDPDGSDLTYRFVVWDANPEESPDAEAIISASGMIPEGTMASMPIVPEDELLDNTQYWWRAWAHAGTVFGPPSELGDFFVNATQDCPTAPALLTPADGGFVTSFRPVFVVQNSTDADGDPILYWLVIYNDADLRSAIANSGVLPEDEGGTTTWQPDFDLLDHQEYWWRAKAIDAEGCESAFSEVRSFLTTVGNETPTAPVILTPEQGEVVADSRPVITVENAFDADRDLLTYVFEVDTELDFGSQNAQMSSPIAEGIPTEGTSWQVEMPLQDNTQYFVRVQAHDGTVAGPFAGSTFRANFLNDPPTIPVPIDPGDGATIENQRPRLTVENAVDPDGETLLYHFELYADDQMQELVSEREDVPENFEISFWRVNRGLLSGTYWWRARAIDSSGGGPWSELSRFSVTLARNLPPVEDDDDEVDPSTRGAGLTDDGCGCASTNGTTGALWLLVLGGLFLRRRR